MQPPLLTEGSRLHAPVVWPPTPHTLAGTPGHTRGSSPASLDGAPRPPVPFAAASSCRAATSTLPSPPSPNCCLRYLHPLALRLLQPASCSRPRRPRAGGRGAAPLD